MEAQKKKVKGFTLLELLVVIAIIGIISATGAPRFNSWQAERKVKNATLKISNVFKTIINYSQSGSFPYTQANFVTTDTEITAVGKGMSQNTFTSAKINSATRLACEITYEDAFGTSWDLDGDGNTKELYSFNSKDVALNFKDTFGICFAKDVSYYGIVSKEGTFEGNTLIVCLRSSDSAKNNDNKCKIENLDKPAYKLEWTRFGRVDMYKFISNDGDGTKDNAWKIQ